MKILAMLGVLFAFAMGATAHAEGVSAEDIECGNNPTCVHSLDHGNTGQQNRPDESCTDSEALRG